jgi:TolB-like protein/DNA-binding winged helix-turn-helix (wHTH) protein/tetratricopeptide (TPR) repeat protein
VDANQPAGLDHHAARQIWRFAECQFDELRRELKVAGVVVEAEAKPLDVLRQLLLRAGEVVTKDELLDAVWPGVAVVDGSLATAVSKLRKALGTDEGIVVTVPRIGYRVGVPVQRKAAGPLDCPALGFAAGDAVPGRHQWCLTRRLDLSPSSEVWLAEHPKTHEARVFKFAPDERRLEGLKREVTVARLLRDSLGDRPEFVRVHEWQFDSYPCFVESEYFGPNLAAWGEAEGGLGAIAMAVRLRLCADIARALATAHSVDVLHKDLKPANVLVGRGSAGDWQIKVADFGSASLTEPSRLDALGITNLGFTQTDTKQTEALAGTLMYVAPEVLAGQSASVAADVYALGVLLYQVVVGDVRRPLSAGWEEDVADASIRDDIADAACGDPARRLQSAAELADRLANLEGRHLQREQLEDAERRADLSRRKQSDARVRRPWVLMTAAALAAVVAVTLTRYRGASFASEKPPVTAGKIEALAVLPLANLSGDPAQDYLAEGMTEALIADLSRIRALKVISRTSVMRYKSVSKPLPEIARELGVDGIVEGSVVRSGNRVRITAQLIQASTDTHLWAERYDRDVGDMLSLQRELARQISREIKITVQPSEDQQLASSGRVNPEAYERYLKGRFFWNRRTHDDLNRAVDYFQQATEIDPGYPHAYAGLADAYVELVGFGNLPPADGIPKAKTAALKAIALNDSLAEPHTALAYGSAADWDWRTARREFQRAIELNPRYVVALYQYGFFLSILGKHEEAITSIEQALELDPLSAIVRYRAGRVYYHARQYDKAADQFSRILELNPSDPLGIYGLGLVRAAQRKFDEAIGYLRREDLQRGFDAAAAYAASGNAAEARRRLNAGLKSHSQAPGSYIRPGWVAEVYAGLGENDESFRWLERAYTDRDAWLALLKVWPPFDGLRSDPRFDDLLRRMKFPE